jgi:nucleoside-diphosphate-sugar epimerase
MSRILVTGGAGFIGSHVVKQFVSAGHAVWVLDALVQYRRPPWHPLHLLNVNYRSRYLLPGAKVARCDLRDKADLGRRVRAIRPEYVVHMIGMPTADLAVRHSEDAFATTVGSTVNLLEVLRDCEPIARLAFVSSRLVYGNTVDEPVSEESPTRPAGIDGGMKLAAEAIIKAYSQQYGIPAAIVRPDVVYGPTDSHRRIVNVFLAGAVTGRPLAARNADATAFDFSHVDDVAAGIKLATLAERAAGETFNLGSGRTRTVGELARVVSSLYPQAKFEYVETSSQSPNRGAFDVTKARTVLGYEPQYALEAGIASYADYLESAYRSLPQPASVAQRRAA